ncbi:MAG: hypothetical protein IPM34_06840 [Saprospiraceae bacterium]|nr:hypothetical protein [Saprospiraceae bacterium]
MKIHFVYVMLLFAILSCKPTIYNVDSRPNIFCECRGGSLQYQLKDADRSSVTFDPASSVSEISEEIGPGGQTVVRYRVCESGSATISAVNGNGTSTHTVHFQKVSEPSGFSGEMIPLCVGSRFDGWSWVPAFDAALLEPYPTDGELVAIRISVDRPGTFRYGSRTIEVLPGGHTFNEFAGLNPNASQYEFIAALNPDEQCAESGSVLPSGRRPPRSFPISIQVTCP